MAELTYWSDPHTQSNIWSGIHRKEYDKCIISNDITYLIASYKQNGIQITELSNTTSVNLIRQIGFGYFIRNINTGEYQRPDYATLAGNSLIVLNPSNIISIPDISSFFIKHSLYSAYLQNNNNDVSIFSMLPAINGISFINLTFASSDISGRLLAVSKSSAPPTLFFYKRQSSAANNSTNPWLISHTSSLTAISFGSEFRNAIVAPNGLQLGNQIPVFLEAVNNNIRSIYRYLVPYTATTIQDISTVPINTNIFNITNYSNAMYNNNQWDIDASGTFVAVVDPQYIINNIPSGRISVFNIFNNNILEIVVPGFYNLGKYIFIDKKTNIIYSQFSSNILTNTTRKEFVCAFQLFFTNSIPTSYKQLFSFELTTTSPHIITSIYINNTTNILHIISIPTLTIDDTVLSTVNNFPLITPSLTSIIDYPITRPYFLNTYQLSSTPTSRISVASLLSLLQYKDENNDAPGIIVYDISYGTLLNNPWLNVTYKPLIYTRDFATPIATSPILEVSNNSTQGFLIPADASGGYIDFNDPPNQIVNAGNTAITFKFRAWDQTVGSKFATFDTSGSPYTFRADGGSKIQPGAQDSPFSQQEFTFKTRITYEVNIRIDQRTISFATFPIELGGIPSEATVTNIIKTQTSDITSTSYTVPTNFIDNMGMYITDICDAGAGTFKLYANDLPYTGSIPPRNAETAANLQRFMRLPPYATIVFTQGPSSSPSRVPSITFRGWTQAFDNPYIVDSSDCYIGAGYKQVAYTSTAKNLRFEIKAPAQFDINGGSRAYNTYLSHNYRLTTNIDDSSNVGIDISSLLTGVPLVSPRTTNTNVVALAVAIIDICDTGLGTFQYKSTSDSTWSTLEVGRHLPLIRLIRFQPNGTASTMLQYPHISLKVYERDKISPSPLNTVAALPVAGTLQSYYYSINNLTYTFKIKSAIDAIIQGVTSYNLQNTGTNNIQINDILSAANISGGDTVKQQYSIVTAGINRRNFNISFNIVDTWNTIPDTSNIIIPSEGAIRTLVNVSGGVGTQPGGDTIDISYRLIDSFAVSQNNMLLTLSGSIPTQLRSGGLQGQQTGLGAVASYGLQPVICDISDASGIPDVIHRHDGIAFNTRGGRSFARIIGNDNTGEIIADITLLADISNVNSLYNFVPRNQCILPTRQTQFPLKPEIQWNAAQGKYTRTGTYNSSLRTNGWGYDTTGIIYMNNVYMTGNNYYGQFGNGNKTNSLKYILIPQYGNLIQIACGRDYTVGLYSDGTVRSCGRNSNGQLGDGTNTERNTPVQVQGITNAIQVSTSSAHTGILIADGTVRTFGNNSSGQLGDGTTTPRNTPVQVQGITNAVQIYCGDSHTVVLLADGTVRTFGSNGNGQLGDGTTTQRNTSVQVQGITNAVQVACGSQHTAVLLADGTVRTFGFNGNGQLGDGTNTQRTSPVQVQGITNAVYIECGMSHTAIILVNGTVRTCGYNVYGQLGDGTTLDRNTSVQMSGITNAVQVTCSFFYTIVLLADGSIKVVGYNNGSGELGTDYLGGSLNTPTEIPFYLQPADNNITKVLPKYNIVPLAITQGSNHSALIILNKLYNVGDNGSGQLGNGTNTNNIMFIEVSGIINPIQVACGSNHTAVILANSTIRTFGSNGTGQLGDGTTTNSNTPVQVQGINNAVQVACGQNHTAVLLADGTIRTFGYNVNGQLGDGTTTQRTTPVQVQGITNAVQVACGYYYTAVLYADGTIRTFGYNDNGQLGDGTNIQRNTPIQVQGINNGVQVACGQNHTAVVCADGTVRTFGYNGYGNLGNGIYTNSLIPVQVQGITNAIQVACGKNHTVVLCADGTVKSFGDNYGSNGYGQLGDGTYTSRNTPVQVIEITNAVQVTCGMEYTMILCSDGSIKSFGNNQYRQLGNRTNNNARTTPAIATLTTAPNIYRPIQPFSRCILEITPAMYSLYSLTGNLITSRSFGTQAQFTRLEIGRDLSGISFPFILHSMYKSNRFIPSSTAVATGFPRINSSISEVVRMFTNYPTIQSLSNNILPIQGQIKLNFIPQFAPIQTRLNASAFITYTDSVNETNNGIDVLSFTVSCISGGIYNTLPATYNKSAVGVLITDLSARHSTFRFEYSLENPRDWQPLAANIRLPPTARIRYSLSGDIATLPVAPIRPTINYRLWTGHDLSNGITAPYTNIYSNEVVSGNVFFESTIAIKPLQGIQLSQLIKTRLFQDTQASTSTGVLVAASVDIWTASGLYITTKATTDGTGALITQVDPSCNLFIRPSGGSGTTDLPLNISGAAGYIMRATDQLWLKNTAAISTAAKPTLNFAYNLYSDISAGISFIPGSTYALSNLTVTGGAKRFSDVSAQWQIRINTRPILQQATYTLNVPPFLGSNVPADVSFSMATVSGVDQNSDQLFYFVSAANTFGLGTFNRGKGGANISGGIYLTANESIFFTPASVNTYTVVGQNPFITFVAADVSSGTTVNATNYSAASATLRVNINVRPSIPNQFTTYQHPIIPFITPDSAIAVNQIGDSDPESSYSTCIINASGDLMAAGYNGYGQLGNGTTNTIGTFTKINLAGGKLPKAVVTSNIVSIVLCTDGTIQGAGNRTNGQLGTTGSSSQTTFQQINLFGGRTAKSIAVASSFTAVIDSSEQLQMFGYASGYGVFGNNMTAPITTPTVISLSGGKTPKQVSCGTYHTVVLCTDGTVQTTGNNGNGQLGTGNASNSNTFIQIDLSGRQAAQVAAGPYNTAIVCTDGTLLVCGQNSSYQLGISTTTGNIINLTVVPLSGNKRTAFVSCGSTHSLVLCTDGTVQGMGSASSSVFGNITSTLSTPTPVFPLSTYVVGLSTGYSKSVLYCADGTVKITGNDYIEQLGLSSVSNYSNSNALIDIPNMRINVAQYGTTTAPYFYDVTAPTTYSYTSTNSGTTPLNVSDMLRDISFTDINADPSGIALFEVNGPTAPQWRYRMSTTDTWKDISAVSLSNALLLPITGQLGLNCVATNASKIPYTIKFLAWDSTIGISGNFFDISTNGALDQSGSAFSQMQTTLQSFVYQGLATYTNSRTQNFLSLQVNPSSITGENVPTSDVSNMLSKMTFSPALTQQTGRPIGIYFQDISGGSTAGRFEYKPVGTEIWYELQTATNLLPTTELRFIPRDISTQTQTVSMKYRLWSPFIGEEGRDLSRNVTGALESRFYSQTVFTAPVYVSRLQQPATIYSAPTNLNTDVVFNYRLPIAGDDISNNRLTIYNNGIPLNIFRHTAQRLLDLPDFSANRTQFRFACDLRSVDLSGSRQFKPTFETSGNIYKPQITISGDLSNINVNDLFTSVNGPNTFINISGSTSQQQTIILWTRLSTYRLGEQKEFFRINTSAGLLKFFNSADTDILFSINDISLNKVSVTKMIDDDWNFIRFSIFASNQMNISINNYSNIFTSNYTLPTGTFNIQLGNNSELQYSIDYRDMYIYLTNNVGLLPPITALNTYQKSALVPIRQYSDFVDISQYSVYISDIINPTAKGFFEYKRVTDASFIPILPQLKPTAGFAFSATTRIRYRITDSSGLSLAENNLPRITCYIYDGSIERFNAPNIVKDTSGQNLSLSGDSNVGNIPLTIRFQIFKELQQVTAIVLTPILYTNKYQLGSTLVPVSSTALAVSNSISSLFDAAADIPLNGGIAITDITNLSGVAILQYRLQSTSPWKPITTLIQPPYTQQIVTMNSLKMGLVLPSSAQIDISLVSNLVYSQKDALGNPIPYNIKFHVWDGRFAYSLVERTYPVSFNQVMYTRNQNIIKQTSVQRFAAFFSSTESTYNIPIYPTAKMI